MAKLRDDKLLVEEARRTAQHREVKSTIQQDVHAAIEARSRPARAEPEVADVAAELRQKAVRGVETQERDVTRSRALARVSQVIDYAAGRIPADLNLTSRVMSGLRAALSLAGVLAIGNCVPQAQPGVGVVYVDRTPPGRLIEVAGVPPRPGAIWMSGHWRWSGREFYWVPGEWVAVRPGYRTWVPARWIKTRRGWYFIEGHWR